MALFAIHSVALACTADEDCNLNGRCVRTTGCACRQGWTGTTCGELDLEPMKPDAPAAYGTLPTSEQPGLSSWGGSIVRDPHSPDRWHLFASEMSHGCGLNAWGRNSVIVHATAASPMGPFVRQRELLPYFAHEPTAVTLPDGTFALYKIGCADGAVTGSNGTGLVGPCTECGNGTTAKDGFCPPPTQEYEIACQEVLHAASLDGPWRRVRLNMSQWDWQNVNLGLESHAPVSSCSRPCMAWQVVLANGSVLTLTRSWGTPAPYPNSAFWLVRADSWDGHYEKVAGVPQPFLPVTMEDSFMWRDEVGHYHALFHAWAEVKVGAHAFSRDGLHWTLAETRAYGTIVETTDGGSVQYGRRERPHLVLDEKRRSIQPVERPPTHLLSAVGGDPDFAGSLPYDFSFTHVQPVKADKAVAALVEA